MLNQQETTTKVGIAGLGAIGTTVAKALTKGIKGFTLTAVSEPKPHTYNVPTLSFEDLAKTCDLIIECLPPSIVPDLTKHVLKEGKNLILISPSALLIHKDILKQKEVSDSRIIVPSGALCGIDGVSSMAQIGITAAKIASNKHPRGYKGAPYIEVENIDLNAITTRTLIFQGNALEAVKAFPANVNVAATLSLAGIGPEKTKVEIWADPEATGNSHEVTVTSAYSTLKAKIENQPDPANPKTSILAAQSIIRTLKSMTAPIAVL